MKLYSRIQKKRLVLAGLAAIVMSGCGATLPPPDSTPRQRFDWAMQRMEQGRYQAAVRAFRDLLFREPQTPTADSARLMIAESHLRAGDRLLAAGEFSQFHQTRPNSPLADDAQLGTCRSYWQTSPDLPRDQEFTHKAIEECTRLIEFFPRSEHVETARDIVREARQKAAAKDLRTGTWYFRHGLLEAAIIYLEGVVERYPEAVVMPQVLYLLHNSYSVIGFQAEADATRQRLITGHPDSEEARQLLGGQDSGDD
ncbi:MAG: outer membrane protein assembly factor BamD [Gemmatimonadota bacterium]